MALAVILAGRATGFERDRSFYPTILIVIALLYVLFSVEYGAFSVVAAETTVALAFSALAVAAAHRGSAALLAGGYALHGVWDAAHPALLNLIDVAPANVGVPTWWPLFCLAVDVALALYLVRWWPPRTQ